MSTRVPGWYDDPEHPGTERFWDGSKWTDWTRASDTGTAGAAGVSGSGSGQRSTVARYGMALAPTGLLLVIGSVLMVSGDSMNSTVVGATIAFVGVVVGVVSVLVLRNKDRLPDGPSAAEAETAERVRDLTDELRELAAMRANGTLSEDEFAARRDELIDSL